MKHFVRHYFEMVLAMVPGMVLLGAPAMALLGAAGISSHDLHTNLPALALLLMAVTMTVPMVAWMRYRGHGWRPCNEMAASMLLPAFAMIALLAGGLVEDFGALMTLEHVVMLPAMLIAMLVRPEEYMGHDHHAHRSAPQEATA